MQEWVKKISWLRSFSFFIIIFEMLGKFSIFKHAKHLDKYAEADFMRVRAHDAEKWKSSLLPNGWKGVIKCTHIAMMYLFKYASNYFLCLLTYLLNLFSLHSPEILRISQHLFIYKKKCLFIWVNRWIDYLIKWKSKCNLSAKRNVKQQKSGRASIKQSRKQTKKIQID